MWQFLRSIMMTIATDARFATLVYWGYAMPLGVVVTIGLMEKM